MAAACWDSNEDDGTIFREINGVTRHYFPGELVHPCGSSETLMAAGGIYGTMNTVQAIWLESKNQITRENVSEALWILSRQVPHLQLCLSRRGWRLWFKRIKKFTVDFEISTDDVMEVYQQLLETKYSLWTGPLWKARLVISNSNVKSENNDRYTAALIFSVHHCITDGTMNMKLCREVVSILNEISAGKQVILKQASIAPTTDESMKGTPSVSYLVKYVCKKFTSTMIRNFRHKSSFAGTIPVPTRKDYSSKVLFGDFSKTESKSLLKMCKAAQITVHSFIVTITNFALLTLAQSKSKTPLGPRNIWVIHCVNMRRYMEPQHSDTSGCHISFMEDKTKISLSDAQDFWNQVKKVHISMKEHLEVAKDPVMIIPLLQFACMIYPTNCFLTKKGYKTKTDCHYMTTNMGDLKDLLPGPKEGDSIEITYLLRSVSSALTGNPFLLTFHTFRERFMISIDYCTNKMSDETAQEFFNILCQFIRNMTNSNHLQEPQKC